MANAAPAIIAPDYTAPALRPGLINPGLHNRIHKTVAAKNVAAKSIIVLVALIFSSGILLCQPYTIKGRVTDIVTKEPLAFVNVMYGKGNLGTTTNIDGWYTIVSSSEKLDLTFIYIGYEKQNETVTLPFNGIHYTQLNPAVYNINEVTVLPGENPANRIMNKVIANKDLNNPEKLEMFSYNSYNRMHFTLEIDKPRSSKFDTLKISRQKFDKLNEKNQKELLRNFLSKQHIFLMETITKRNYNGPGKNKETVIASKTSGLQQPYIFLLANQFQSFTLYGEEFELGTRKYVSPVCNSCTGKYLFIIEDTLFNEFNDTIFVISFRPSHGKNFNALSGVMHINSNRYAVENINAAPTVKDTVMDVRIQQKYTFIDGKAWFPTELNTNLNLNNLSGILIDTIPINDSTAVRRKLNYVFAGTGKSYLDSINLKPDFSGIKFNHVEIDMDKKAVLNNPKYFEPYRPDSLTEKDLNTYHFIDSIGKTVNLDNKIRILSYALTGNIPVYFIDIDLYSLLAYNEFEGLRLGCGIKTNDKLLSWMSLGTYAAYGFKDDKLKYGYSFRIKQPTPGEAWLEYSYSDDVHEPGKSEFSPKKTLINSEVYRLLLLNPMDYEESHKFTLFFRPQKNLTTSIFASENNICPDSAFNYSENIKQNYLFRQVGIKFRYIYRESFTETFFGRISMGSKYPDINASIAYFQNETGNEFIKSEFKITSKLNFHFGGTTKASLRAGYLTGTAPLFLTFNANGSFAPFSLDAENTFQTMTPYEFFAKEYISVFLRHNFGKLLFNSKRFKPEFELVHNMGISSKMPDYYSTYSSSFNKGYFESGLIINNILNISFSGYGIGIFYRYGYYSSSKPINNLYLKLTLTLKT